MDAVPKMAAGGSGGGAAACPALTWRPLVPAETKVYVGNLGTGAGKGELERAFSYYGPLRTVWIARNPPGFAFVEFEDPRDAEDAVLGLDGKIICGSRVRVEVSTGMPRRSRYDRPPARRPFDPNDRCYECGEKGHYAYDCHRYSRRRRSRSRSASYRRSRSMSPRRYRSFSPRRSRSGSLRRSRYVVAVKLTVLLKDSLDIASLSLMVDLNLAYLLKVTHHQEALEGMKVLKEWVQI
ncbi:hypothetical protein DV515_00015326 [Chloebia gouldiae]|uniref:Serine/arginine-rich splicing factor 7 n=1 Tax=Chloebia gouldiae TaxID=44316 RepID=A0A3L8RX54_CHLGU|nr:hypothetical protein DV515_00015326 [Chloebia gouldiae]